MCPEARPEPTRTRPYRTGLVPVWALVNTTCWYACAVRSRMSRAAASVSRGWVHGLIRSGATRPASCSPRWNSRSACTSGSARSQRRTVDSGRPVRAAMAASRRLGRAPPGPARSLRRCPRHVGTARQAEPRGSPRRQRNGPAGGVTTNLRAPGPRTVRRRAHPCRSGAGVGGGS